MHRLIAVVALSALVGCSANGEPPVSMTSDHAFDPESVTVAAGTEVVFTNDGNEPHTVTAYEDDLPEGAEYFSSGGFDSEEAARDDVGDALVAPGERFTVTLEEPGTYTYFCIPHEDHGMTGEIVVE